MFKSYIKLLIWMGYAAMLGLSCTAPFPIAHCHGLLKLGITGWINNLAIMFCLLVLMQCKSKDDTETQPRLSGKNILKDTTQSRNKRPFEHLLGKFLYNELDSLSFLRQNYSLLYHLETHQFKLYRLTWEDMKTLQMEDFLRQRGYELLNDKNYPKLYFTFCKYQISDQILALSFLNHEDGAYSLDLLSYKNQKLVDFSSQPIAFSWQDAGFIKSTEARRISKTQFLVRSKYILQNQLKESYQIIITINEKGEMIEKKEVF